ncbi:MAG: DNA-protecting protein DprA [Candidatus Yanofskybacteria bacterium]|nr:DNA-protecting protein DprA [Candidatus Yanofskybacteria bacterium]
MDKNLKYLNAINVLAAGKIGALQAVHNAFGGDWERAWSANLAKYIPQDRDANGKLVLSDFQRLKKAVDPDREWTKLEKEKIRIITILDEDYPKLLTHIHTPPFLLYIRGSSDVLHGLCFGIVGTRALSEYGRRSTPHLVLDIARAGFTIVSGLAAGIDTLAHKSALEAGAKTIAVLGTGIDDRTIFPALNLGLAHKIIENGGAVISEYAAGTHGTKFTFPQRNRIVSGLSKGVLVVEADERSGALITAAYALEQNRDVFAVPGGIFTKTSRGPNNLIKKGAKPVTCAEDVLEEYDIRVPHPESRIPVRGDNPEEERILAILTGEPMTTDDIIRRSELDASLVAATLTVMELNKKIKITGNKYVPAS